VCGLWYSGVADVVELVNFVDMKTEV
jgi:hypothetical protein